MQAEGATDAIEDRDSVAPVHREPLKPLPLTRPAGILVVAVLLGLATQEVLPALLGGGYRLAALVAAYGVLLWIRRLRTAGAHLEVGPEGVRVPSWFGTRLVRWAHLQAIEIDGIEPAQRLVIETASRWREYRASAFLNPGAIDAVVGAMRRHRRDGLLDRLVATGGEVRALRSRSARVTRTMFALVVTLYAVEVITGAIDAPLGLVRLGANAPLLVARGEWFRLVAASFLHDGRVHLGLNVLSLLALGSMQERLIGPRRFLLVYLVSGLAAGLTSTAVSGAACSVGASGAIFGILGAQAVLELRHRARMPRVFRSTLREWGWTIALNALLPVLVPSIDVAAHVGGFVAGALVAAPLLWSARVLDPQRTPSRALSAVLLVVLSAHAWALVVTVVHALTHGSDGRVPLLGAIAAGGRVSRNTGNTLVWDMVTDREAPADGLEYARIAAERLVEQHGDDAALADTLATAYYRVRRYDDAVRVEAQVVQRAPAPFYSAQLLRFLYQQAIADRGNGGFAEGARLALEPRPDGGAVALLSLPVVTPRPAKVEAFLAGPSGAPLVFVSLCASAREVRVDLPPPALPETPTEIRVTRIVSGGCELPQERRVDIITLLRSVPEVMRLP